MRSFRFVSTFGFLGFAATLLFGACGRTDDSQGGETNWLRTCETDDDCIGAQHCICGMCTLPCAVDAECESGPPNSQCAAPDSAAMVSRCSAEPSAQSACLPTCDTTSDCAAGSSCVGTFCVATTTFDASPRTKRSEGESCSVPEDCFSGLCMGFGCAPEAGVCVAGEQECADVEAEFCTCDGQTSIDRTCPLSRYAYRGACAPSELQAAQVVYDSGGNLQEGPAPTLEVGACGSGKPAEVVAAQLSNQGINARFAAMPREGGSQYLFLARSSENCEIVKVDKTRCSTEIFDSLPSGPNGCRIELAASASHVFWTYGDGDDPDPKQPQIFRRPIAGGETEQIPVGSGTRLLAADSTHAYGLTFVPGSAFELVRIASRTESVVGRVLDFGPPFVNISVAESEAIIGAWNPVLDAVMLGALVRIDLSTNTLQLLAKQDRLVGSSAALFGDYVYYCSSVGVMRLAKNGGPHTRIISGAMSAVADCSLKVDATGLYFNANNEPALVHANLDGGNPKRIAPPNAHGKFAIDDTHIYWLSPEGDLLRMLKPKG